MQKQVKVEINKTSAKDVTKKNRECKDAFLQLKEKLKKEGLIPAPKNVSATTIYDKIQGFRFDAQSRQGNRCHYAFQQNGAKGKTNIMTITIEDITNQNDVKKLISKILQFNVQTPEAFISQDHKTKKCYDFSI